MNARDHDPEPSAPLPPPPPAMLAAPAQGGISLQSLENSAPSPPSLQSPASPTPSLKRPLPVDEREVMVVASPGPPSPPQQPSTTAAPRNSSPQLPQGAHPNTPPTKKVLERNQACLGCRQRKRKCDGGKPSCGACERLERECVYTGNAVTKIHSSHHRPSGHAPNGHGPRYRTSPPESTSPPSSGVDAAAHAARLHTSPGPSATLSAGLGVTGSGAFGAASHAFTPINVEPPAVGSTARLASPPLLSNGRPSGRRPSVLDRPVRTESPGKSGGVFDSGLFALSFLQASPFVGLEGLDFSAMPATDSFAVETPRSEDPPKSLPLDGNSLPERYFMMELFDLFFQRVHPILPCLYRKRVLADIEPGCSLYSPNTLTYSILAIASHLHPSTSVKAMSPRWNTLAQQCFHSAVTNGRYSLSDVQGGIYTSLRMFCLAQMSELWVFLGSVWRMCVPLGLHQIDSQRDVRRRSFLPHPRSELELEERRRAMWAVYLMDRLMTYSVGWSMNINDREFCVNFPASEEEFQSGSIETAEHIIIDPFVHNLPDLIPTNAVSLSNSPDRDPYQWLCKLSVLVGRVSAFTNAVIAPEPAEFNTIETTLVRFILSLPKKIRSPSSVSDTSELPLVVLINLLYQCAMIQLYSSAYYQNHDRDDAEHRCDQAVEKIVATLKLVVPRVDPDRDVTLTNAFIGAPLYSAAQRLRRSAVDGGAAAEVAKANLEVVMGVFGRLCENWPALAEKWRVLIVGSDGVNVCLARYGEEVVMRHT